jgi:Ribbon-helix-helix protein, copG family
MSRMVSVRISEKARRAVARLARATGRTESDVVREAIDDYVGRTPPLRPYEALQDVIGMVEGGPTDLSEKTGEKFRALLLARPKARR